MADTAAASTDLEMMTRCIEISQKGVAAGELPFAAIVCKDGKIIAESSNRVVQDGDVSRHAEILALSLAQQIVGSKRLRGHTLYTNVEPCPMCAFAIRETGNQPGRLRHQVTRHGRAFALGHPRG